MNMMDFELDLTFSIMFNMASGRFCAFLNKLLCCRGIQKCGNFQF